MPYNEIMKGVLWVLAVTIFVLAVVVLSTLALNYGSQDISGSGITTLPTHKNRSGDAKTAHIIRDELDMLALADYILTNPLNWEKDEENQKQTLL